MRLFLVCTLSANALFLSGCFGGGNLSDPVTDTIAQTPFMYKPDIQQGNVVTQRQVNKLEPGMSEQQVRYLMGTPMLQDTFHQNRWDYVYTMKRGGGKVEKKRVSLFFEDGQLSKIKGDYRPDPGGEEVVQETVVTVPDQRGGKGIISSSLNSLGLGDETPSVEPEKPATVSEEPLNPAPITTDSPANGAAAPVPSQPEPAIE